MHKAVRRSHRPSFTIKFFDLDLAADGSLLVIGESSSGKSTLARALAGLEPTCKGSIRLQGQELLEHAEDQTRDTWRRQIQIVPENPLADVSPGMRVQTLLERRAKKLLPELPLQARRQRIAAALSDAGLSDEHHKTKLRKLSVSTQFRLALAGALLTRPKVIICDAPATNCNASEAAEIRDALMQACAARQALPIVTALKPDGWCEVMSRMLSLYLGRIMEHGSAQDVADSPAHPYTRALLAGTVHAQKRRSGRTHAELRLEGETPNPAEPPIGCIFHPRCPISDAACIAEVPVLRPTGRTVGHYTACLFAPAAGEDAIGA